MCVCVRERERERDRDRETERDRERDWIKILWASIQKNHDRFLRGHSGGRKPWDGNFREAAATPRN